MLLNEGLLCMSKSDYAAATDAFQAASAAASDDEEKLAAENNLAVCKFYTKARASTIAIAHIWSYIVMCSHIAIAMYRPM